MKTITKAKRGRSKHQIDCDGPQIILTDLIRDAYSDLQGNCLTLNKSLKDMLSITQLATILKSTPERAAIISLIFCQADYHPFVYETIIMSLLKNYFPRHGNIRLELRELKRIGIVERQLKDAVPYYCLTDSISRAIDANEIDSIANIGPHGLESSLEYFKNNLMSYDSLSPSEVDQFFNDIVLNNQNLKLVSYCNYRGYFEMSHNAYVLFGICAKAIFSNNDFEFSYMPRFISYNKHSINELRMEILHDLWAPIKEGLVENAGGEIQGKDIPLKLTGKGYNFLLGELDPEYLKFVMKKNGYVKTPLIYPQNIQKTPLYFDAYFQEKIERLDSLLSNSNFQKYQRGFHSNAKMKGLTILFHGDPGCGKTEYALQLAKKTNRPLMKIDITDFQSKWLGESEKQLKQIFTDYRTVCESNHNNIPILFLNECDQIIGKRISINSSLDQITNGIQNILLEEMESFNGILIGTSNLVNNMDGAFERRWLLKLQFASPTKSARVHIWKSKIKCLKTKDAIILATQFDFTPAEISNIAKKYAMEKLLGLKKNQISTIIELGESERFIRQNQVRCVGF
jgi:hypothetical protein